MYIIYKNILNINRNIIWIYIRSHSRQYIKKIRIRNSHLFIHHK